MEKKKRTTWEKTKEGLRAQLPERLNKLGEWWISDNKETWEIYDMKAGLK